MAVTSKNCPCKALGSITRPFGMLCWISFLGSVANEAKGGYKNLAGHETNEAK